MLGQRFESTVRRTIFQLCAGNRGQNSFLFFVSEKEYAAFLYFNCKGSLQEILHIIKKVVDIVFVVRIKQ